MKYLCFLLAATLMLFSSCGTSAQKNRIDIDVAEFNQKMQENDVVILDVRTPDETAQGKIKGAIEIDVKSSDFNEKIQELDKDKTYLVYCRSGRRSVTACDILEEKGFEKLYNLLGGYNAYSK